MIILAFSALFIPIHLAFINDDDSIFSRLDTSINYLYMIDIVLTFFTSYENKKEKLETSLSKIAKAYIFSWFFLDVIAW